jgi:cell division protein FtsB
LQAKELSMSKPSNRAQTAAKPKRPKGFPWLRWLLLGLGVWLAYDVLTGPSGLMRLQTMSQENAEKRRELDSLVEVRESLARQKKRLATDSSYMEAMARKELGMAKPGEKIYRFEE